MFRATRFIIDWAMYLFCLMLQRFLKDDISNIPTETRTKNN